MHLDSLQVAIADLQIAAEKGVPSAADPYAGMAAAYRDLQPRSFRNALDAAYTALEIEPEYHFAHSRTLPFRAG